MVDRPGRAMGRLIIAKPSECCTLLTVYLHRIRMIRYMRYFNENISRYALGRLGRASSDKR